MSMPINERNETRITVKVASGLYGTPDEVIDKALQLLDEYDRKVSDLRAGIQVAINQADSGQLTSASEVFEEIEKRNAERSQ